MSDDESDPFLDRLADDEYAREVARRLPNTYNRRRLLQVGGALGVGSMVGLTSGHSTERADTSSRERLATRADAPTLDPQHVTTFTDDTVLNGAHDIQIDVFNRAHVVGKGGTYGVVDVSDPSNPAVVASDTTLTNAQTVFVTDSYSVVGDDDGLHVYDVTAPDSVTRLDSHTLQAGSDGTSIEMINGMARRGEWLFAADKGGQVHVVDISDPPTVSLFGTYDAAAASTPLASPHDAVAVHDRLVICSKRPGDPNKVQELQVSDTATGELKAPSNWSTVWSVSDARLDRTDRVVVNGRYCYVASQAARGGVAAIDRTSGSVADVVQLPDYGWHGLGVAGRQFLLVAGGNDIRVFDISSPKSLSQVASDTRSLGGPGAQHDIEIDGAYAFGTTDEARGNDGNHGIPIWRLGVSAPPIESPALAGSKLTVWEKAQMREATVANSLEVAGSPVLTHQNGIRVDGADGIHIETGTVEFSVAPAAAADASAETFATATEQVSYDSAFSAAPQLWLEQTNADIETLLVGVARNESPTGFELEARNFGATQPSATPTFDWIALGPR